MFRIIRTKNLYKLRNENLEKGEIIEHLGWRNTELAKQWFLANSEVQRLKRENKIMNEQLNKKADVFMEGIIKNYGGLNTTSKGLINVADEFSNTIVKSKDINPLNKTSINEGKLANEIAELKEDLKFVHGKLFDSQKQNAVLKEELILKGKIIDYFAMKLFDKI